MKYKNKKHHWIIFFWLFFITFLSIFILIRQKNILVLENQNLLEVVNSFEKEINNYEDEVISLEKEISNYEEEKAKIYFKDNFFIDNFKLKDYSGTKFKLTEQWKDIVTNIRKIHKSASLISGENRDKAVCAWYIWTLSEKLWWDYVPYHLWMLNADTWYPAKAWELASFYSWFWWEILIDFSNRFDLKEKNYYENIKKEDLQSFFEKSFKEEALFWDIWFLYKDTNYSSFLNKRSYNSHITKNMWLSEFEYIVEKDYELETNLEILKKTLACNIDLQNDLYSLLKNYKLYLNWEKIVFYDYDFYFLQEDNSIWEKVKFKYLDKISYEDITLSHYFEWSSKVNSLFEITCSAEFYPINVMTINSRLIEKM